TERVMFVKVPARSSHRRYAVRQEDRREHGEGPGHKDRSKFVARRDRPSFARRVVAFILTPTKFLLQGATHDQRECSNWAKLIPCRRRTAAYAGIRPRGRSRGVMVNRTAATGATTDARDQSCVSALCATQWHRIRGGNDGKRAVRQGAGIDGCVLAGDKLRLGRPELSLPQPPAHENPHKRLHVAPAHEYLADDTQARFH